jgi:hypothetical protein
MLSSDANDLAGSMFMGTDAMMARVGTAGVRGIETRWLFVVPFGLAVVHAAAAVPVVGRAAIACGAAVAVTAAVAVAPVFVDNSGGAAPALIRGLTDDAAAER